MFDRTVNAKGMKTKDSQETHGTRYMEDYGNKYIHKLPQFITTLNSRRNSSIYMRPNTVNNCDLMCILYSKPLREYKKPTFKTGDRVRSSKYEWPFRKRYKPQFTRVVL